MAFSSQPALLPSDFGFSSGSAPVKPSASEKTDKTATVKKVKRKQPSKKQSKGKGSKSVVKKTKKPVKNNKGPLPWK
jgi:hypothetical protein